MNRYFLLIGVLQLWPEVTPVDPITTWAPLFFIFAVSAIKEAADDFNRYQHDKMFNSTPVTVLMDGQDVIVLDFNPFSLPLGKILSTSSRYDCEDQR